jgi:hypothetical protein
VQASELALVLKIVTSSCQTVALKVVDFCRELKLPSVILLVEQSLQDLRLGPS